jgi:uncharacterized repeat protein (TIGR02543 family)
MNLLTRLALKNRPFAVIALCSVAALGSVSLQSNATAENCSTVTFFPNGAGDQVMISGSRVGKQKVCGVSGSVQVPAFTREGYTLSGWTKESGVVMANDANSSALVPGLTAADSSWTFDNSTKYIFGQWEPVTYSITYDLAGGEGTPSASTSTFESKVYIGATIAGSTYSFSTPTKEGFNFGGWSLGSKRYSVGEIFIATSNDIIFTAVWTAK